MLLILVQFRIKKYCWPTKDVIWLNNGVLEDMTEMFDIEESHFERLIHYIYQIFSSVLVVSQSIKPSPDDFLHKLLFVEAKVMYDCESETAHRSLN